MATVGFDFGTTNSLISVVDNGRVIRFLDLEEQQPIPSVVSYEGERRVVGKEAKRRLAGAGLGVHGNTVRSPKSLLGKESVFVEGVERSPVDIVSHVVEFVRDQALASPVGRRIGAIDKAVVTIPINMEGRRRASLRDAFRAAGIRIVQFIHEPLAALYAHYRSQPDPVAWLRKYNRKYLLVFDWGGGTLDLTLCRFEEGMLAQRANDGTDEVGGDVFDEQIRNEVIARVMSERGLPEDTKINPEARSRLLENCERAKIELSSRDKFQIFVPEFFQGISRPELVHEMSREQLEEICHQAVDKGLNRIEHILELGDVSRRDVALCLATGGMANMPAIRERLHQWFGPERVHVSEQSATLISEGAAWSAHDGVRLHLAKNVELLLARNIHFPLLPAGTEMPQEGEVRSQPFHFYCADPRDGIAKFLLESPERPGMDVLPNEPRRPLAIASVRVDRAARPLRERLELEVRVDDNLILRASARSLNAKDIGVVQIHDLEFGLRFGDVPNGDSNGGDDHFGKPQGNPPPMGSLVARSNIAPSENKWFVPGELLYQIEPSYFDLRNRPPEDQDDERLYYVPCAVCGRASNDPLCRCASLLDRPSPGPRPI